MDHPFEEEDIEDVRILIKAKGKHWALSPMQEAGQERCSLMRKMCLKICLFSHVIVTPALEDVKNNKNGQKMV